MEDNSISLELEVSPDMEQGMSSLKIPESKQLIEMGQIALTIQ